MKKRIRFGIKVPVFANAATFVFYVKEADAHAIESAVEKLEMTLRLAGQDRIADRIVFHIG